MRTGWLSFHDRKWLNLKRPLTVSAGIEIEEKKKDDLQYITLFNIETRYDEYKRDFHKKCTRNFAEENISKIKRLRKWLKEKLKK